LKSTDDRVAPVNARTFSSAGPKAALLISEHCRQKRKCPRLDLVIGVLVAIEHLITGEMEWKGAHLQSDSRHSPRADNMFVAVNSGSVPQDLLESSLFGHVKGAFTSAVASRKGWFEVADRGTIFFDEISTIGPDMQAKLLRVIQEREFMPLGSAEVLKVDVRIIAACNEDLKKLVEEKRFREDLYYRLNVIISGAAAADRRRISRH
jgi:transcriptional regulator of acetoin/glycerol metabolism